MKILGVDRKSIFFKMTSFVIILIVIQSIFLTGMLIAGGVLSQAKQNAFQSFSEKVKGRNDYIQRKMKTRWNVTSQHLEEISKKLATAESNEAFFEDSVENLIDMLRSTETTGAFIILDSESEENDSLYIRDYDPRLNDYSNKDLYMILGSSEIAKQEKIPLDQLWKYKMKFDETNKDFFEKPYSKAGLTFDSKLLGYWSKPFNLFPNDISIMTYTMPLFDSDKVVRGIIGIEISQNYLEQYLPATDLQPKDSMGYLLAYSEEGIEDIKPVLTIGALQKRMINLDENIELTNVDLNKNIYKIKNVNSKEAIYACIEPVGLYNNNTPFENESWYLIGMINEGYLLGYFNKIQSILLISLVISIVIGVIGGYINSYSFTKPIRGLVKQVKRSNRDKAMHFNPVGLTEIDELSKAMEIANNELLEAAVKMSKIIDLTGVPIGAFESNNKTGYVFVTD